MDFVDLQRWRTSLFALCAFVLNTAQNNNNFGDEHLGAPTFSNGGKNTQKLGQDLNLSPLISKIQKMVGTFREKVFFPL